MATPGFEGFPRETLKFLGDLAAHNDRDWFQANRKAYEAHYLAPATAFIEAIGPRLREISPGVDFEAKTNRTIRRINRDTRFSKDKSPYKTHMDLWFWEGPDSKMGVSGFFFRMFPHSLLLGVGMHEFSKDLLERYRAAVVEDRQGKALEKVVAELEKGGYQVGGETYKKVPRGLPADHPRARLLRHSGVTGGVEMKPPKELHSPAFVDFCLAAFRPLGPLHRWLTGMAGF